MSQNLYEMVWAAVRREKRISLGRFYRLPDFRGIKKSILFQILRELIEDKIVGFNSKAKIIFIREAGNGKE